MVRVHGLPRTIVSDNDSKFTSHFWEEVFKNMGTTLAMCSYSGILLSIWEESDGYNGLAK